MLKTYDEAGTLLEAIDALQLPRDSWVATDADGTLWAADVADLAWHRLLTSKQARPHAAAVMARLMEKVGRTPSRDVHTDAAAVYALYQQDLLDDMTMVHAMTACWAGWRPKEVEAFGEALGREAIAPRVYATTRDLLRGLHARGLKVAVVSGSPRILVEAAVRGLGLPFDTLVVGAETGTVEELLDDVLARPIPWEAGKVDALRARIGGAAPVAMGDTLGDRELLESATKLRVLVHPRPALRSLAMEAVRSASLFGDPSEARWVLFSPPRTVGGAAVSAPTIDRAIAGP